MGAVFEHRNTTLRYALLASLALHAIIAYLIPALSGIGQSPPTFEVSLTRIIPQLVIHTPAPAHKRAIPVARAPIRSAEVSYVPHVVAARVSAQARTNVHLATKTAGAPVVAPYIQHGAAQVPRASPMPLVTSAPQVQPQVATTARAAGGDMPLGAEQPIPVLDPSVQKALSGLGIHVTLIVTVDENGHTKDVAFDPPLDGAVESQIRSMLASATWDPAVCGAGVACEGTARIKL